MINTETFHVVSIKTSLTATNIILPLAESPTATDSSAIVPSSALLVISL